MSTVHTTRTVLAVRYRHRRRWPKKTIGLANSPTPDTSAPAPLLLMELRSASTCQSQNFLYYRSTGLSSRYGTVVLVPVVVQCQLCKACPRRMRMRAPATDNATSTAHQPRVRCWRPCSSTGAARSWHGAGTTTASDCLRDVPARNPFAKMPANPMLDEIDAAEIGKKVGVAAVKGAGKAGVVVGKGAGKAGLAVGNASVKAATEGKAAYKKRQDDKKKVSV